MRYAIWNNKGGVGKTFLTFVIACEYADQHPERKVMMLDLCPQANLSEIVLGGNGYGADRLSKLIDEHQTIGGYFDDRISNPQKPTGTETRFLIERAREFNPTLPANVGLVAGDSSLEIQAQAVNQISAQTLPQESWANVHKWVMDLIGAIDIRYSESVFFIDCNPSFASYTELAILASERLIVPCSADGSSARAIDNVGRLIYGTGNADEYGEATFNKKAVNRRFALPSIHTVILNRSTQYDKKASRSFNAMFDEIKKRVDDLESAGVPFSAGPGIGRRFLEMPDAHSVAVVCSHKGIPLSRLETGPHTVHDTKVQVNKAPYERYKASLTDLVSAL